MSEDNREPRGICIGGRLTYHNAWRRHSALFYLSPTEFEQQHHKQVKLSFAA